MPQGFSFGLLILLTKLSVFRMSKISLPILMTTLNAIGCEGRNLNASLKQNYEGV